MPETFFGRLNCYLTGHDYFVRSNGARIYLCCAACGRRTTGWSLGDEHRSQQPQLLARPAVANEVTRTLRRSVA